jgi:predicted MPP superfamily phosphohydrolase
VPDGRSIARTVAGVAVGIAGSQLGLRLAGRTRAWIGPLRVSAGVQLGRSGGVHVQLPPAGSASIASHRGPISIQVRAEQIDPDHVDRIPANEHELRAELSAAAEQARGLARTLAVRSVGAAAGGAALSAAACLRSRRDVGVAALTAAGVLASGAAVAAGTRDRDAWREPQLQGLLRKAPLLLGDLRTAPGRIEAYRAQLIGLLCTATTVYRAVTELPEPPPVDAIRLLHLSDIHLSPLAYPLAKAVVDEYDVDVVVDTGDLVDWGTPAEQAVASQVAGLGVPYVFVKGNHDSRGIAEAVARQPNATVLDAGDEPVDIAGLRFAGMADPRFTPDKTTGDDRADHRVSEAAGPFAASLAGRGVDIALAHDPAAGRALADVVPLVLSGHTHRRSVHRYGETVVLVQGTSGGAGLRGVQAEPRVPVSLSVLYLDRATRRLVALDELTLGGIGEVSLNVVRRSRAELLA